MSRSAMSVRLPAPGTAYPAAAGASAEPGSCAASTASSPAFIARRRIPSTASEPWRAMTELRSVAATPSLLSSTTCFGLRGKPWSPRSARGWSVVSTPIFSAVRVHTDARAAQSALLVNAEAYASGRDIVFAPGRFAPHSSEGQRLLAHELSHVVEHGGRANSAPQQIGDADSPSRTVRRQHGVGCHARQCGNSRARERIGAGTPPAGRGCRCGGARTDHNPGRGGRCSQPAAGPRPDTLHLLRPAGQFRRDRLRPRHASRNDRPQDADTGPAPGQSAFGGQQRINIGPRYFNRFR